MIGISLRMLAENKSRLVVTVLGIAALFFLSAATVGLLVGWCLTTSAIVRNSEADLWVMAQHTPAFDYSTPIPRQRIYQVRSVDGVQWAEGLFIAWNIWQRPDGRRVNVELVGLDDSCVGGPWRMREGLVENVHLPDRVIVDELFLEDLGVRRIGDEVEMLGRRAIVGGISKDVRTFTTAPFIFTSIDSALRYDPRYAEDEITYVLVRCSPGRSDQQVRQSILREVAHTECLTTREFAVRTMQYWMFETGAGITVVITAVLGFVVAGVVISQTVYATTQDHLSEYATLLALGFSRLRLSAAALIQSLVLGICGTALGSLLFIYAAGFSEGTPIPLETTPLVYSCVVAGSLGCCPLASFLSIKSIFQVDPIEVFRA